MNENRLAPLVHIMAPGNRIDAVLSHTGAFLLEIDGKHYRQHDFDLLAAPECFLKVWGSNHADGAPTALHTVHEGLLWFRALWREDLGHCQLGGKFLVVEGDAEKHLNRHDLFAANVVPRFLPQLTSTDQRGRNIEAKRIVIECWSADMSAKEAACP